MRAVYEAWVDDTFLAGPDREVCLSLDRPVDRASLRELVATRQQDLAGADLRPGGTVALQLPPSVAYVVSLLAVWRSGGQVTLLDHRLTRPRPPPWRSTAARCRLPGT